jgi:hypothetical protein
MNPCPQAAHAKPVPEATQYIEVAMSDIKTMSIEKLTVNQATFDPAQPELKAKLLAGLGFAEPVAIQKMDWDEQGAFNEGIWSLSDCFSTGVILKLVPHERARPHSLTDTEKYTKLQKMIPNILGEFSLSFPVKIFELQSKAGGSCKDLIVMRRAMGLQITQHLYHKFHGGAIPLLLDMFKQFGVHMSTIHRVYRDMQHGDCQPSNVFYDDSTGIFTLIDVADFGYGPYMAEGGENDVEHFISGLKQLSQFYGEGLISECVREFRAGYLKKRKST